MKSNQNELCRNTIIHSHNPICSNANKHPTDLYLFIVCLSFKHHVSFYGHLAVVERKCCQGQPLGKQQITTRSTHPYMWHT